MPTVRIFGPMDGHAWIEDGVTLEDGVSTSVDAGTFGEALASFGALTGAVLAPYRGPEVVDDPRSFTLSPPTGDEMPGGVVDIHILRGGEEICPRHDLDLQLEDGDILVIGLLVC